MKTRKPAMTANEARENVAAMMKETAKPARVRLLKAALRIGNLSDEARDVYRAALAKDGA